MKDHSAPSVALEASPARDTFARRFDAGEPQVVWTTLVADLETPVSAYLKLASAKANTLLLESVEGGAVRGRYSIIGLDPDVIWRARGQHAELSRTPERGEAGFVRQSKPTLASLRDLLAESRIDIPEGLPPMAAGIFGYMGYDTIRLVERLENVPPDALGVPDGVMMRPTIMVIFDSVRDEMTVVTPVRPPTKAKPGKTAKGKTSAAKTAAITAADAYAAALARLARVVAALDAPLPHIPAAESPDHISLPEPVSNTTEAEFGAMVRRAKEYIVAGDIFQVVLSQRFSTPFALPSIALYRSLRRLNPSPFLFHLDMGDFALVGSSPEILVRVREGEVTIRPIAGTTRRGASITEDQQLADALLRDPKERAEHLMLLDLGRNDVGRVAEIGTVSVTDQFVIERYSHVMHIVSNVVGRLDSARHDAVDALLAGFPAGTVSGAPKVRAMEIIDELEKVKRGPYAGCVGYFSATGDMDTCIVLRTAIVKDGMLHVQAGAGVVHDSIPENEQQECINKAKAVVRAAEGALATASRRRPATGNGGPFG